MSDDEASDSLALLLGQPTERVEMNYLRALDRCDLDPVVLLLDLSEPRARALLGQCPEHLERAASVAAEGARRGAPPLLYWGLPRKEALRVAGGHLPGLAEMFEGSDPGEGYHLVAVCAGGYAVVVMPPLPV